MADRRLNSNLGRDANNDKGVDAAISQSEVEPSPFESRHRQFVEYALSRRGQLLGDNLKSGSIA